MIQREDKVMKFGIIKDKNIIKRRIEAAEYLKIGLKIYSFASIQ